MRSNYERNQFKNRFLLVTVLLVSVLIIWGNISHDLKLESKVQMAGSLIIIVVALVILYTVLYRMFHRTYSEIENVAEMMLRVMEQNEDAVLDDCKEGSIGILYSNYSKMVYALKKSREKELDEKIFLRDIISDISHQLKTPLASLNVFVDLLLEDKVKDEEKQKQILTESQNQLNRMEWMVLSMLKLARIEAGAIQFKKMHHMLFPLVLQAVEGITYLTNERRQKVEVICKDDISFDLDGEWFVEALINLLKNASDYSGDYKNIIVEVEENNAFIRIYVKDEGPGIAQSELPNIFKRFYRVNQQVNPNSVGIGLSLTKSIVEGMGGSIRVESRTKDEAIDGRSYTWFAVTFVK